MHPAAGQIATWLLCESMNARGEHICFEYKADDQDPAPVRDYRAQRYLRRVCYGNFTASSDLYSWTTDNPAELGWHFHLLFDYGERSTSLTDIPAYDGAPLKPWTVRPDSFSTHGQGFELGTRRLCQQALLFHHFPGQSTDQPKLVRRLLLQYRQAQEDEQWTYSQISAAHYQAFDANGVVENTPPIEFDWASETARHVGTLVHRWLERIGRSGLDAWSQPGVFAWDRIDPGSALLAEHLPAMKGEGVDLGAGSGELRRGKEEGVAQGGAVVWILLSFSVFALTITLAKAIQLWQPQLLSGAANKAFALLAEGKRSEALLLVHGRRNPRCRLLSEALEVLEQDRLSCSEQKEEVARLARLRLEPFSSWLRPLEVIASVSTLLGLFGTVLGMIQAFQALEQAGTQVNPSVLSGGIWVALLTTAVGLAVSMPVMICHSALERRLERLAAAMANDIDQLFTLAARRSFELANNKARLA